MYKLFDAHSDIMEDIDEKRERGLREVMRTIHLDRWRKGGCVGGFCPVWVDPFCEVYKMPVEEQVKRIILHMSEEFSESAAIAVHVTDAASYEEAVQNGKHAVFTGTEGLSFLRGDWGRLDELHAQGMREYSLTWNETNEFAGGAGGSMTDGLTRAGRNCVMRINTLGDLLDLAHSSKKTFFDAVSVWQGPFMVSHGNIAHLCENPRNITDEQLKVIAEYGGVLGISAYGPFLSKDPSGRNVRTLCDHIEYAAEKMRIECVGLGFDFVDYLDDFGTDESLGNGADGIESVAAAQNIATELERRGLRKGEIEKVFHDNFLDLIKRVIG